MENPEISNTSTKIDKKKKSKLYSDRHGSSSDQEDFMRVDSDVKPRRSFWKNLFRKTPKRTEVPEMASDENKAIIPARLNAIFEEPKTPEEREPNSEEIEDIKQTLKRISPSASPPSVLLCGISDAGGPVGASPFVAPQDALLDYLSDASASTSETSATSIDQQQKQLETTLNKTEDLIVSLQQEIKQEQQQLQQEQQQESEAISAPNKLQECSGDPKLLKEAYSFEYSETSDDNTSSQEAEDDNTNNMLLDEQNRTQDKVKFDEKVEQKDADSNIVVGELNPGPFDEEDSSTAPAIADDVTADDPQPSRSSSSSSIVRQSSEEEEVAPPDVVVSSGCASVAAAQQQNDNYHRFPMDSASFQQQTTTNNNNNNNNNTGRGNFDDEDDDDDFNKNILKYSTSLESVEESEIWSERLNQISGGGISKSVIVLPQTTTTTTTEEVEGGGGRNMRGRAEYRRLDDFFKMIFRQTTHDVQQQHHHQQQMLINYSVAYDPIFANFNVQCYQPQQNETAPEMTRTDEKQKVVRKRKMMSLLNDKMKMAEYLREIEQQQQEEQQKLENNCEPGLVVSAPHNSPSKKNSKQTIALNENNDNNEILILLESTKQKLQKYLEKNVNTFDPKAFSLYPDNYLDIFNLITNNNNYNNNNNNKIECYDENNSSIFSLNSFTDELSSNSIIIKQELNSLESLKTADDSTVESKLKQFQNIDREIENIFTDLLVNISELKDNCILYGVREESEPPITVKPLHNINVTKTIIKPLLNELVDRVVDMCEVKTLGDGHFASNSFSFVKEFGMIYNMPGTVNITKTTNKTAGTINEINFEYGLQRTDNLLTALCEEMFEYNPVFHLLNSSQSSVDNDFIKTQNNIDFVDGLKIIPKQTDKEFIPRHFLHLFVNNSNTNDSENNSKNIIFNNESKKGNKDANTTSHALIRTEAESLLQNIEEKINSSLDCVREIEKSKKFGPYYDRKPGESRLQLESTVNNNNNNNKKDIPEITDSLQHIFFGENSGEILQSEFNLVEDNSPKPGTSKNHKNSIDSVLSQLPSIPSVDLYINSPEESSKNVLQTLVENRFSGLTGNSEQAEIPLDFINNDQLASFSSESPRKAIELERKSPETNLHNFCAENLSEINKSIEENMKIFQDKMQKINKMNAKTIEMLTNSNFSTPEGSLSILSTITENMTETVSKCSKISQDRYPQYISNSTNSIQQQFPNDSQNKVDKTPEK